MAISKGERCWRRCWKDLKLYCKNQATPRVQVGQQTQKFRLLNTPKASKHNLIMYTKFYREEKSGTKKMLT